MKVLFTTMEPSNERSSRVLIFYSSEKQSSAVFIEFTYLVCVELHEKWMQFTLMRNWINYLAGEMDRGVTRAICFILATAILSILDLCDICNGVLAINITLVVYKIAVQIPTVYKTLNYDKFIKLLD